ncbi:MAG: DNA polymerase III subunit delta [Actinomycetia bacterium]|nr:DNA polymerase III subunit delta [Actinomycetes bacterium]
MAVQSPLGSLVLVVGPESLLAERAVERLVRAALEQAPQATVSRVEAASLDAGRLLEITGSALLAEESVAVVTGLDAISADVAKTLVAVAQDLPDEVALVCVHPGGVKGRQHVEALKKIAAEVIDCPALKAWELAKFVTAEVRRARGRIDEAAAQQVVDAVGSDTRALASAVSQLLADAGGQPVTSDQVRRYFAGRAEVTGFAVVDDVMNGNHAGALEKLRWALATGVAPVMLTSNLAVALRQQGRWLDLRGERMPDQARAKEVGVPPWKLKDLDRRSRAWTESAVAAGIRAVAQADAAVKGAESDPAFALERLLLTLYRCRQAARQR